MQVNAGTVAAVLSLDTKNFSDGITSAKAMLRTFHSEATTTGQKVRAFGESVMGWGKSLTYTVSATLAATGAAAVKTYAGFEDAMLQVKAVSGATAEEYAELTEAAKAAGKATRYSAAETAQALNYMAMAGWKNQEMLDGLDGLLNLAAASGTDLASTADIVTDALTAMGYGAKESGRLADVMAAASANANTNVQLMGYTFKYAAAVAGTLQYSMEDLAVATGLMGNAGIKGEMAGTQLRAGMLRLISPTTEVTNLMEKYGISITNSDGTMRSLMDMMRLYRDRLGDLSEAEKAEAAAKLFGTEAAAGWLSIINASEADFEKLTAAVYGAEGAAASMAETMESGVAGSARSLKSAVEGLMIEAGEKLAPFAQQGIDWLRDLVRGFSEMDDGMQSTIIQAAALAAAVGPALIIVGKAITMFTSPLGIATVAITGLAAGIMALKKAAYDRSLEGRLAKLQDSLDMDLVADMKAKANVDMTEAESTIEAAVEALRIRMKGIDVLSDDEQAAILAVINGDVDPIIAALMGRGLTEEEARSAGEGITQAWENFREAVTGIEGVPDIETITALIGEDYDTIVAALMGMGMTKEEATAAADTITAAWDGFTDAVTGIKGVASMDTVVGVIDADYDTIAAAMRGLGLSDEDANAAADMITAAWSSFQEAVGGIQGVPDMETVTALIGKDYDEIVAALTGMDMSEDEAKAAADRITGAWANFQEAVSSIEGVPNMETVTALIGKDYDEIVAALMEMDTDMSEDEAKAAANRITDAWSAFSFAVLGIQSIDGLDDVTELIGKDYDEIVTALTDLGMTEKDAEAVAEAITSMEETIRGAATGIDLLTDDDMKTLGEAVDGDKEAFIGVLKSFGLSEEQIEEIAAVYDATAGSLKGKIESVYKAIGDALTDGKEDTPEIVADLKESVGDVFQDALDKVDAMGEKAGPYAEELLQLQESTNTLIDEMAGKSTEECEARLGELQAIEDRVKEIAAEAEAAALKIQSRGEVAYEVASSGVTKDTDTIAMGAAFARVEYEKRTEAAKQAEEEGIQAAQDAFALSKDADTYKEAEARLKEQAQAEIDAAEAEYKERLAKLSEGVLKAFASDDVQEKIEEWGEDIQLRDALTAVYDSLKNDADATLTDEGANFLSETVFNGIEGAGARYLSADQIQEALKNSYNRAELLETLRGFIDGLESDAADFLEDSDLQGSDVLSVLMGTLAAGGAETDDMEEIIKTATGKLGDNAIEGYTGAMEEGKEDAQEAGKEMAEASIDAAAEALDSHSPSMEFYRLGVNAVEGMILGARSREGSLAETMRAMARAAVNAAREELDIHSPSGVFREIGRYVGKGFALGVSDETMEAQSAMIGLTGAQRPGTTNNYTTEPHFNFTFNGSRIRSESEARELMLTATRYATVRRRGFGL